MMQPPHTLLRPHRQIVGMSAILLPFDAAGDIDWKGFAAHVERTAAAGLIPAINMDTGFGNLIDVATKSRTLQIAQEVLGNREFIAGAFVADSPGAAFDLDAYRRAIEPIRQYGGTPIIFQSYGLTSQPGAQIIQSYEQIGRHAGKFLAFELGGAFAPFGAIYDLETYGGLLGIKECWGAKHSSLRREPEWERVQLRDRVRPDFLVLTGNDLAIDMVMYGCDYLLGLSTFAPAEFALRDRLWKEGHAGFYELNDVLQYLGAFAFRAPVPAYKHSAAMFMKLRGWIAADRTHAQSAERPDSDREVLQGILNRLNALTESLGLPSS
jgi:dihydrodipicolinate synthase/N-acetylneuraminate lyase